MTRPTALLRRLRTDARGLSTIEFALVMPLLLTLGLYGAELAYMASVKMQVSELAGSVADNASRIGQTDNSGITPTISETDINSVMKGAEQQGASFDFKAHGRLILTSLEVEPVSKKQWIHWQRCFGSYAKTSSYGNDTTKNGVNGPVIAGLGPSKVTAASDAPLMFVEVWYQYQPLFGSMFVTPTTFKQEAAFQVRDDRNVSTGLTGSGSTASCA